MPTQLDPQTGLLVKDQPITPALDAQGNYRDTQGTLQHDPNWVDPSDNATITPPANTGTDNTDKPKTSMNIGGVDVDTTDWTDEQRGLANQQIADNDQQIADYSANKATYEAELATIDSEAVPLIQNIKIKYDKLIADMNTKNKGVLGNVQTAQIRTGRARYASELAEGQVGAELNAGASRISELNGQMAQEISLAKESLTSKAENRFAMLNTFMENVASLRKEKTQVLVDINKSVAEAEKTALEKQKTTLEMQKMSQEIITKNLDAYASGFVNVDENGQITYAKDEDLQAFADEMGIPVQQISGAVRAKAYELSKLSDEDRKRTLDLKKAEVDALNAGLSSAEIEWKNAVERKEFTGGFLDWVKKKAQAQKVSTGTGIGVGVSDSLETIVDKNSKSILAATGLSLPAFAYLTQGTAALTRMTAGQRLQYMNEAQNYLNKSGTDVATFKSQYTALGQTVEANTLRNNQAGVAETELEATIDNLRSASQEAGLKNLKGLNAAKIWAGKELNKPNAATYKFHLEQIRNEFAMYNAAISGQIDANGNIRQINEADLKKADEIIQNGFAAGSIDGFEKGLKASMEKMGVVLKNSIDAQNKQVWKLFGVGDKFKPSVVEVGDLTSQLKEAIKQEKLQGSDNFISPDEWNRLKGIWTSNNGSESDFNTNFSYLKNPNNKNY